ncbi:MAG: hypothetical protein APR54_12625 [Candidatus Cloacimonas sp. SDB]|nr:MAG: hypothetical protein APR54_12625 [Candidatus Cloacimonas sp. SDB]
MLKKYIIFSCLIMLLFACSRKDLEQEIDQLETEPDPYHYVTGSLEKGETLAHALLDEGLNNVDVYQAVNKLNEVFNLRRSHPADSFIVKLDSSNVIMELSYIHDPLLTYKTIKDTSNIFFTRIDTLRMTKIVNGCAGEIESSLYKAMIDAGEGGALPVMFTQIFQWDIDFFIDPQKGDQFRVVYEQYMNGDKFMKYGNILIAQYSSKNYDKQAYFYTNNAGISKYYDESGVSFQKAFLKSPLNYRRITSYFGSRVHPITKKVSVHHGVDYAAAYGTPVEAAADGTVIYAAWHPNHTGNTVKIRHANGYKTLYGHLSKFGKYKVGDRVQQHDIIGYVGSTGRSTGNHLHYTIYHHDVPINPLKLNNVSGPPVPESEIEQFKLEVRRLQNILDNETFYNNPETVKNSYSVETYETDSLETPENLKSLSDSLHLNRKKERANPSINSILIILLIVSVLWNIRLIYKIRKTKR